MLWWRWWAGITLVSLLVLVELTQIKFWELLGGKTLIPLETTTQRENNSSSLVSSISRHQPIFLAPERESQRTSTLKQPKETHLKKNESREAQLRSFRMCSRDEIHQGEWVAATLPKIPYSPYSYVVSCQKKKEPWQTWDWRPFAVKNGQCILVHWDPTLFCSLAKHATVAIVGDSLSWEQYASLVALLDVKIKFHRGNATILNYACQDQVRLAFVRSNDLKAVANVIQTTSPNVLIINRGAHFVPNKILEPELRNLTKELLQWQHSCEALQRPCHLLVRTSVPGHPHCWNFTQPATSVRAMEEHIADLSKYNVPNHFSTWARFKRQNELSLRVYEMANLSFDVIDGYHINILRPDEHLANRRNDRNDCLHSCLPGKMDVYNQLLLHFLQARGGVAVENASWTLPTADKR